MVSYTGLVDAAADNLPLQFLPIDFNRHSDLCVEFLVDAFVCSGDMV